MSSRVKYFDLASLEGVCTTFASFDPSDTEGDVTFQEVLKQFVELLEGFETAWKNLENCFNASAQHYLASQNPAVIVIAMQLAYRVVEASEDDESGPFLTEFGIERVQMATEAKELLGSTARAALAGNRALGELAFQSEDLGQAKSIVAAVLSEFLGLLSPAERTADSPHAIQRLLVCLVLGRPLSEASGKAGVGIRAWKQWVAGEVVLTLQAAATGDQSKVDWTLVRSQMAVVVEAIAAFVPGGRSQTPLRVAVGALLVVYYLTMVLPEALLDVAKRPASELTQFSPRRPEFGDPARRPLLEQFELAAHVSQANIQADTEHVVDRTVGLLPADGPPFPPRGGQDPAAANAGRLDTQHRVDRPQALSLGRQPGNAPSSPPKEPAQPGPARPDGQEGPSADRAPPEGTYLLPPPIPLNSEEQPDAGRLASVIEEEHPSFGRELSGFSEGPSQRALQQSVITELLGTVAHATEELKAVSGFQKDLLGHHARGVVAARSVFDISLLQGGNHMVSPYTIMSLLLRDSTAKTGEGLNMSLLDSADPSRAGIISLSARPISAQGLKRSYQFTLIRRLDCAGKAVMSPMSGPSIRNLFPVALSQVEFTERRLVENLRAACREGLLSQESFEARVQYVGRIFSTVRDLLQPFMHSVTTSDGVFKWYFQRWAAVSVFILRCFNRPLLPPQMAGVNAVEPAEEAEPLAGPADPFLREGFLRYLPKTMAKEAVTIRNFLGHASDHKDKAVGYPIVPALLLSLTTCGICGSAGGISVAYDGRRVDRTLVHCEVCAPNPTISEHEALVEAINEKQPFSAPLAPAAPAFGECRATMNPLFYSPKAGKSKPVTA